MTVTIDGKYPSEIAAEQLERCSIEAIYEIGGIFRSYNTRERDRLTGNSVVDGTRYHEGMMKLLEAFVFFKKALNDKARTGF
jgi:hypothetical protein